MRPSYEQHLRLSKPETTSVLRVLWLLHLLDNWHLTGRQDTRPAILLIKGYTLLQYSPNISKGDGSCRLQRQRLGGVLSVTTSSPSGDPHPHTLGMEPEPSHQLGEGLSH